MQGYKDVDIGDRKFRIGQLSAMVGSYIVNVLTLATLKAQSESKPNENADAAQKEFDEATPQEKADTSVEMMWLAGGGGLSLEKYSQIQIYCLQVCAMYPAADSETPPIPLLMVNGRWAVKELESDIHVVNRLILETLKFNLAPFFQQSASEQAAPAKAPALNPPRTRPVMASSSVR